MKSKLVWWINRESLLLVCREYYHHEVFVLRRMVFDSRKWIGI